mgnify:CR=1 FL=1
MKQTDEFTLYIDNTPYTNSNWTNSQFPNTMTGFTNLQIGKTWYNDTSSTISGTEQTRYIRFYNRGLTQSEVTQLYNKREDILE